MMNFKAFAQEWPEMVRNCPQCHELRAEVENLRSRFSVSAIDCGAEVEGWEELKVTCSCCNGRGYVLTMKAEALLWFLTCRNQPDPEPEHDKEEEVPW